MFTVTTAQELASIMYSFYYCDSKGLGQNPALRQHEDRLTEILKDLPNGWSFNKKASSDSKLVFDHPAVYMKDHDAALTYEVTPTFASFTVEPQDEYSLELDDWLIEEYETEWPCDV